MGAVVSPNALVALRTNVVSAKAASPSGAGSATWSAVRSSAIVLSPYLPACRNGRGGPPPARSPSGRAAQASDTPQAGGTVASSAERQGTTAERSVERSERSRLDL